ncbi:MAG TPA: hypothetical protein VGQ69_00610 [Gemmatimonadales bacterium]|jgi:hypothetical protein|nr:hypothetical protein [Gemmatimonadales bacterium]
MPKRSQRVREQVVVYLDARDRELLDKMTAKTGLPKTELFRRGLRRLADEALGENRPGSSLRYLVSTAGVDQFPPDVSERADHYLYGSGYEARLKQTKRKRARPR